MSPTTLPLPLRVVPVDDARPYVPLLLDRSGERRALRTCDDDTWAAMTPMIAVARHGKEEPSRETLKRRARNVGHAVGDHPFYVDLAGIKPCRRVATPHGDRETLAVLHAELARRDLRFMPVARTTDGARTLRLVAETVDLHGRGLALRHRLGSQLRRTGESAADRVSRTVDALGVDPDDVDLVLDLDWLDPDGKLSTRWVVGQVNALAAGVGWRTITLAATCVPLSVTAVVADMDAAGSIPRSDWRLWQDVVERTDVVVRFGDHGVQHPKPPAAPKDGRTYGNLRYSTPDSFLVSRGHLLSDMDDGDFGAMCRRVTSSAAFSGEGFSWGDRQIHRIAQLRRTPSLAIFDEHDDDEPAQGLNSNPFWREVGTSHHLTLVAAQINNRALRLTA